MTSHRDTQRTASRRLIVLTPFRSAEELVQALRPFLEDAFHASVEIGEVVDVPADAYNPARRQYHSAVLLDVLVRQKDPECERQLGITDVDLYTPELNFVFGQADARRGIAVFSVARLHTADRDRLVHRAVTEAIHELAHTYGLTHCTNRRCVMWFSSTLEETDRKGAGFCQAHAEALARAIGRVSRT